MIISLKLGLLSYKGSHKVENINYLRWKRMESGKKPIMLFEIGNLQVYHFQTQEEFDAKTKHTDVYWRDKTTLQTIGPFPTIYDAVSHYVWTLSQISENAAENVIHVDFLNRKRRVSK